MKTAGVVAVLLLLAAPLVAQQPTAQDSAETADSIAARNRPRGDSIRPVPPISPRTAFLRSLLLPGWGQSTLGRHGTAALFVGFEGFAGMMYWKASWQLDYARARQKYVKSHTQEKQDWLVLLIFNHVMAGAEAFVSANLYDFPASLKAQVMPDGRRGLAVSIPF